MTVISTERLLLRQWQPQDKQPFAAMNADPEVMRYFPSTKSGQESDDSIEYFRNSIEQKGWGLWATEIRRSGEFIGFIGIHSPQQQFSFSPCVEIGWRIGNNFWRRGYASEGAQAVLKFAFEQTELVEIVSMTPKLNTPSIGVMEKIGMTDSQKNFEHPGLAEGHRLSEHVLYTITKSEWLSHKNEVF